MSFILSIRRFRLAPFQVALAGLCLQVANAAVVSYSESSSPAGVFSSTANLETGTTVTTRSAPQTSGSLSLVYWTINGVRQADASGRFLNPASFTILEQTSAVAFYLPTSQDSDADGMADWYEIQCYNSLAQTPASDTDADGISMATERLRGWSPVAKNDLAEGGVSRRRGVKLTVVAPTDFTLTETSSPTGLVSGSRTVLEGQVVDLSIAPASSSGYAFTGWFVNGQRIDSPLLLQPVQITITGNVTAEARYVSATADTDTDGILDWYEMFHFGTLTQTAASDSDADGFDLRREFDRSQSPGVANLLVEGGVSRRRGIQLTVAPITYVSCTLDSNPPGLINEVMTVAAGTEVTTDDLWGRQNGGFVFVGWEIGGLRQTSPSGESTGRAVFVAEDGLVATARFISSSADSDSDGVSDWFEWVYFGGLSSLGTSDADGDGLDLRREEFAGLSPLRVNQFSEGGISRRRSGGTVGVNLQPFERLRNLLVDGVLTEVFTETASSSAPTGMDFGSESSPALCDWDGDGDLDVFVASSGAVKVYENIGSKYAMNLVERTSNFSGLSALCMGISRPQLASGDWNLDGRGDLVLSDALGQVHLIPSGATFAGSGNGAGTSVFGHSATGVFPAVGDLNGDGRVDLLLASEAGVIEFYPHTGNPAAPYDQVVAIGMNGVEVLGLSSLAIGDITLDGRNDVLAADGEGRIWEFHSQADGSFILRSKVWGGSGVGFASWPKIAAGDLEGDGDIDLVGGSANGALFALRDPKVGRPTGLTTASGADSVLLQWNPDWQSRIKGYQVYRSVDSGASIQRINSAAVDVPRYLDQDLQPAPVHGYRVTALTEAIFAGNTVPTLLESPPSAMVSAQVRRAVLGLQNTAGFAGSFVRVFLSIDNSVGLSGQGMDLRVQYPAGLIPAYQSYQVPEGQTFPPEFPRTPTVQPSGLANDLTFTSNESTAAGELRIQGTGGTLGVGQGKLFTLTFLIDSNAAVGTNYQLGLLSALVNDTSGSSVPVTLQGGTVRVEAVPNFQTYSPNVVKVGAYGKGDVNGDGLVTLDDLGFLSGLFRRDAPTPSAQQLSAGDTNGDGKLDHKDMVGITRIISGLEP